MFLDNAIPQNSFSFSEHFCWVPIWEWIFLGPVIDVYKKIKHSDIGWSRRCHAVHHFVEKFYWRPGLSKFLFERYFFYCRKSEIWKIHNVDALLVWSSICLFLAILKLDPKSNQPFSVLTWRKHLIWFSLVSENVFAIVPHCHIFAFLQMRSGGILKL